MNKIVVENMGDRVIEGDFSGQSVLTSILDSGLDWMHACGANGRCTTCRFQVVAGADHLSPLSKTEKTYRSEGRLLGNERLACQSALQGEVTVRVPEDTQLPHQTYTD